MAAPKVHIGVIAGALILLGVGLTLYKAIYLGFPLLPGTYREVWTIESKISITPTDGPVEVDLRLPEGLAGWAVLEEHFASSGFGFTVIDDEQGRVARWTRQTLDTPTTLYYKMQAYRLQDSTLAHESNGDRVEAPMLEADQLTAIERLVGVLREQSSGPESFAGLLATQLNAESQDQDARFLLGSYEDAKHMLMLEVLAFAGIPAREIRGIQLEDGRRRQTMSSMVEVYDGDSWIPIDPDTGTRGLPEDYFVWERGDEAVLSVSGGRNSSLEFALVSNSLPARTVVGMEQRSHDYALLDFSIYSLPVEQQGMFKGLLLIPVAALIVVIMRVLVGLKTSGTFMPILIALAFLQTKLLPGLAIFITLVGVGLWIRSWLSHMNLLLVSRISAVVIVVIFLMAMLAIISYRAGIDQALTVTFFPIIILAWTIERMSILWEEEGVKEVLRQGGGSLLVATIAYLAMSIPLVEHLTFNFPEMTLCLLGVILLLGKYTGYRLSELYRFRDLASEK